MALPIYRAAVSKAAPLRINPVLVAEWLVQFLRDECTRRRGVSRAILGLSGGVDSAVVAALCTRAFGPDNVYAFRMPYKVSSQSSLDHAQLVSDALGIHTRTIEITGMVDGYTADHEGEISPTRLGNICARCRTAILFDQSAKLNGLPIGTGNKSERLMGYYTWHADDAPPINPLGDLFKTQVWQLAAYLEVPDVIIHKPASADLVEGQTDEGDFGVTYAHADLILDQITAGATREMLLQQDHDPRDVKIVWRKVASTHWKRRLPTVAMISTSAIGEYYLRPVDY